MKSGLFFGCLKRFQAYIAKTTSRKVVLLLDNCSAHGAIEPIYSMGNVTVTFLPPNYTSKIQQMDADNIAVLNIRYRTFLWTTFTWM